MVFQKIFVEIGQAWHRGSHTNEFRNLSTVNDILFSLSSDWPVNFDDLDNILATLSSNLQIVTESQVLLFFG